MMNMIYLIDFENVAEAGTEGIELLTKSDIAVIFFGKQQTSVSIEFLGTLLKCRCKVSLLQMGQTGHNYLDMQLAAHAGYLMKENPKADFTIVSKDKGFDSVIDYLQERNHGAARVEMLKASL